MPKTKRPPKIKQATFHFTDFGDTKLQTVTIECTGGLKLIGGYSRNPYELGRLNYALSKGAMNIGYSGPPRGTWYDLKSEEGKELCRQFCEYAQQHEPSMYQRHLEKVADAERRRRAAISARRAEIIQTAINDVMQGDSTSVDPAAIGSIVDRLIEMGHLQRNHRTRKGYFLDAIRYASNILENCAQSNRGMLDQQIWPWKKREFDIRASEAYRLAAVLQKAYEELEKMADKQLYAPWYERDD